MTELNWISWAGISLTKPIEVEGFASLSEEKQNLFTQMLHKFYLGFEYPERWIPVKVTYITRDRDDVRDYLRIDFEGGEWLHFTKNGTWY